MKICRIISAYSPYSFGGADIYAEKISRELAKRNNPTVIITINPGGGKNYEDDNGTKIYRFHPFNISTVHNIGKQSLLKQGVWTLSDIYNPYSYCKIKQILKQEKPDIVHLHTPLDVTLSAFDAVKSLKLPLICTLHDYLLLCRRVVLLHTDGNICTDKNINPFCRLYRKFTREVINRTTDMVISPSEFALNLHIENGFFINAEKKVLPHGIELNQTGMESRTKHTNINILYSGGLTRHKGIHILIQAFKAIKNSNISLSIVGGGIYEAELRRLAGNDKRIIFCGKFSNKETRQFYQNSDVLVVPSIWYDVRPNVIPEAFREGVPVAGANIGGIPELVRENKTGFLFKAGDVQDLKQVLERIISEPQLLTTIGKNCLEFVKQFEMGIYLDNLLEYYKQTIELNRRKRQIKQNA